MKKLIFILFLSVSTFALGQPINVFLGDGAGKANTTGTENSFLGYYAGADNTTGSENTFLGYGTGRRNKTGERNNFIGHKAGYANTEGSRNNFVGHGSGIKNTTGIENSFSGYYTGGDNTTGSKNTFLGFGAGRRNVVGNGNVCVGYLAGFHEKGSNKLYIANSDTGTPLIHGDFGTSALTINGALTVTGDAFKAGGGSWSVASDRRLKKDIQAFNDGLEVLKKINPVRFRYNGKADMPTDKEYVGIIAQEMKKTAPYTIGTFTYKDKDGKETEYLNYDETAVNYIMVNAIKEQQQLIEAQQKEIESLKSTVYGMVSLLKKKTSDTGLHAAVEGKK